MRMPTIYWVENGGLHHGLHRHGKARNRDKVFNALVSAWKRTGPKSTMYDAAQVLNRIW